MAKLNLPSDVAKDAVNGDSELFTVAFSDIVEEWRWGVLYETVITDSAGKYWSVTYRVQTGDNYYNELDDSDMVEFTEVKPVETVTVKYVTVKD